MKQQTDPNIMGIRTDFSSKAYVNSIFNKLSHSQTNSSNHASGLAHKPTLASSNQPHLRQVLLTLHFLFPHELLPALDLLDRKLVAKFPQRLSNDKSPEAQVFYVQSASAITEHATRGSINPRFRNTWSATKVHYEVRLDAWNCTCAAFAQAQLKLLVDRDISSDEQDVAADAKGAAARQQCMFGGVATNRNAVTPLCKHILAAALFVSAPHIFGNFTQDKDVSMEEIAAWSAGWGEA